LSLTAFVVSHCAIHDRGIDEGLNHEQSDLSADCCMTAVASSTHGLLASLRAPLRVCLP
jgi:hypothetical protein